MLYFHGAACRILHKSTIKLLIQHNNTMLHLLHKNAVKLHILSGKGICFMVVLISVKTQIILNLAIFKPQFLYLPMGTPIYPAWRRYLYWRDGATLSYDHVCGPLGVLAGRGRHRANLWWRNDRTAWTRGGRRMLDGQHSCLPCRRTLSPEGRQGGNR